MIGKNKNGIVVNAATIVATMIIMSSLIVTVSYISDMEFGGITGLAAYQIQSDDCDYNLSDCKSSGWVAGSTYCLNESVNTAGTCMTIDANNIILDCKGYNITGDRTGSDYGVSLNSRTNITIRNCWIDSFYYGIYLKNVNNSFIENNTIFNSSSDGILFYWLSSSSNNNTIENNTLRDNGDGIKIRISDRNNIIRNNLLYNNTGTGMIVAGQGNNFTFNNISGSRYNFYAGGSTYDALDFSVDTSNYVEGKPVYYLKNVNHTEYGASTNAGGFYCIKCNNVTVRDLNISSNRQGVFFFNTTNSSIINLTIRLMGEGIEFKYSSYNTIANNTIRDNYVDGIQFDKYNFYNTIINNTITNNSQEGMDIDDYNSYNNITSNIVRDNGGDGIVFDSYNSYNLIANNTIDSNDVGVEIYTGSNNSIVNNVISNILGYGVYFDYNSYDSEISYNIISNCTDAGIYFWGDPSSNHTVNNNTLRGNKYGIQLDYDTQNVTITNNTIVNNSDFGIYIIGSSNGSLIYNNYFNNTINAWDTGINDWNITKTPGTNIVNGDYLGGNYWAGPNGYTGQDTDSDNIGNTLLPYNSTNNITNGGDYLPLIYPDSVPPSITIESPENKTYTTSSIDFNVSANENLSYCKFSIDDWATNYTMIEFNSTYFNYTNSSIPDS
jgi:parallel beta-helix repeat protein